jgi:addiction module HigA family antidote
MTQKLIPARTPALGRILHREIEARGWTQKQLAKNMGYSVELIGEIIHANIEITPEIAAKLSQILGTSTEFWINLEANYQQHHH